MKNEILTGIHDFIQNTRNTPVLKNIYRLAGKIDHAYNNPAYNNETNGEFNLLKKLSISGEQSRIIFDVGANHLKWSERASELFPNSEIHAFELSQETIDKAPDYILKQHPNIKVNNFGLFNKNQKIEYFYYPTFDEVNTLIGEFHKGGVKKQANVIIGDDYCKKNKINQIDFLKLDVEGSEDKVLDGFKEMIEHKKVKMIQFEYGQGNIMTHFLLFDFYNLLESKGYVVGKLYPEGVYFRKYTYNDEDFVGPNFIAVLKEETKLIEALKKF
ncbi:MAG TPA: FkbM family methyltransferase [Candidatus Cloacimonas acidaminovorans]|nr:FkbM family methyltransferase [Candidatus Cloacimonas acidaminovorans]